MIQIVLFHEKLRVLLAGDISGTVVQYDLHKGVSLVRATKTYSNLGLGWLQSNAQMNNLAIFGGAKQGVRVLDIRRRRTLSRVIDSAVGDTYSLCVCPIHKGKVYLAICGDFVDYTGSKSDVLDLSEYM